MMKLLLFALAGLAGAAGACQSAANAALAGRAGLGPALLINAVVVLIAVVVLSAFTGGLRAFTLATLTGAPLGYYIGGLCGCFIIAVMAFAFPRVGGAFALALFVLGTGVTGVVIDHFGLWGMRVIPLSVPRAAGVVLLVAGMILMRR
jgi:bacterial/archaeal transporter family-2 protein